MTCMSYLILSADIFGNAGEINLENYKTYLVNFV